MLMKYLYTCISVQGEIRNERKLKSMLRLLRRKTKGDQHQGYDTEMLEVSSKGKSVGDKG